MNPAMGVLPRGEEGVEEHEGRESYLWVGLVGAGVAGGGLSAAALLAGGGRWRATVLWRGWASGVGS